MKRHSEQEKLSSLFQGLNRGNRDYIWGIVKALSFAQNSEKISIQNHNDKEGVKSDVSN
jgi:hypothetical protein